ncbi:hypothetical protein LWI28_027075 [Acer negundo]|uniref:DUF4005 domain-containing protein n=1 Tax=Acer negundo TaxID=4023 RepID=A0AAD5NQX5_ACENE|nr:hypothetical protein LWI28_027075 [Acer negundo]
MIKLRTSFSFNPEGVGQFDSGLFTLYREFREQAKHRRKNRCDFISQFLYLQAHSLTLIRSWNGRFGGLKSHICQEVGFRSSSKSNDSKGREKVTNERDLLVAVNASEADATFDPPLTSHLTPKTTHSNERKLELENKEAVDGSESGAMSLPGSQVADSQNFMPEDAPDDPERIRQEEAATKAQAAFRGYLARRAFRALKGIIRLQALIRGHLVRRQAGATLFSMLGIVKLQALVRGIMVRQSDIGFEVRKKCNIEKLLVNKPADSVGLNLSLQLTKMTGNAFVRKLLASSPTMMPLHLQYDSEEPNSVSNWLKRWSASCFWKPVPQPKKVSESKSQKKHVNAQTIEAETGRPKRSFRRVPAANIDSNLSHSTPEFEKSKRTFRKISSHSVDPVQENPQNELEKVKRSLRKVHNPIVENSVPVQSEVEFEKPKLSLEKVSITLDQEVPEQRLSNSGEKMRKETTLMLSKLPVVETTPEPLQTNGTSELPPVDQAVVESKPVAESNGKDELVVPTTNAECNKMEDATDNENTKSGRKAYTPAKQERAENGLQSSPALPSYMAATESAKAKLRLQGSPRSGQESVEKNSATRRHSLPSSTNSKISSQSPRTQRLNTSGKGGNKSDKSRDGNGKVTQVDWKR